MVVGQEPWALVPGPQLDAPLAVERNADGRLEVFLRPEDGILHHCWQGAAGAAFGG